MSVPPPDRQRGGQAAAAETGLVVADGGGELRRARIVEDDGRALLGEGRGVAGEIVDHRRRVAEEAEVERVVGVVAGACARSECFIESNLLPNDYISPTIGLCR